MGRKPSTFARPLVALLGVAALAVTSLAQEPATRRPADVKQLKLDLLMLKAARTALADERAETVRQAQGAVPAAATSDSGRLRLRVAELLARLGSTAAAAPTDSSELPLPPLKPVEAPPPESGRPLNALALAQARYHGEDYAGALTAFRQVDLTELRAEERLPVQFLTATCLRRLGKADEAAALYREVANSRLDPVMAECAQWELAAMRSQRDLHGQIEGLKQRRKALEKRS